MKYSQNINNQRSFNVLSKDEKLKELFYKGENLAELKRKNVTILLFCLNGFFVDVYKGNASNEVVQIRSFDHVQGLFKYQLNYKEFARRFICLKSDNDNHTY